MRLLGLPIQPIFVFDGPNKPAFKRNKRSGRGDGVATAMAKRLIRLFGFYVHDSPGEAEAECALLQQRGIVDAVLSEDVDTLMFGCTRTLRNWSADGPRANKTPTHVSMYDTAELKQGETGLDREGMVLVALMSGGDYIPEGVPGCGVKVACEAAKGGFGRSLCRLKKSDSQALTAWRDSLLHELRTNESGFFRTRHKALAIPESFPNLDVLRYYTHPVVSQPAVIEQLQAEFPKIREPDITGLREFVRETFDWSYHAGAVKFVRVLAPSLLVQSLLAPSRRQDDSPLSDDLDYVQRAESAIVNGITNRRTHFSTDATPELRVSYTPASTVGIDFQSEPEEPVSSYGRDGLALNSDDDFEEAVDGDGLTSNGAKSRFDPEQPDLVWIPESVAKLGVPLTVEDWEAKQRSKAQSRLAKAPRSRATRTTSDMPAGALDRYLTTTKPMALRPTQNMSGSPPKLPSPARVEPLAKVFSVGQGVFMPSTPKKQKPTAASSRSKQTKPKGGASLSLSSAATAVALPPLPSQTNPWTLASSQARPRITKSAVATASRETIIISSSPAGPPSSPPCSPMKHVRSPPAENGFDSDPFASPTESPMNQKSPAPVVRVNPAKIAGLSKAKGASSKSTGARKQTSIKSFVPVVHKNRVLACEKTGLWKDRSRQGVINILELSSDEENPVDCGPISARGRRESFSPSRSASIPTTHGPEREKESMRKGRTRTTGATEPGADEQVGDASRVDDPGIFDSDDPIGEVDLPLRTQESRARERYWRVSDVVTIDLTGEDSA